MILFTFIGWENICFCIYFFTMKTLTNSGFYRKPHQNFQQSVSLLIVILSSLHNDIGSDSKRMGNLNSALKKPTANYLAVILKSIIP